MKAKTQTVRMKNIKQEIKGKQNFLAEYDERIAQLTLMSTKVGDGDGGVRKHPIVGVTTQSSIIPVFSFFFLLGARARLGEPETVGWDCS